MFRNCLLLLKNSQTLTVSVSMSKLVYTNFIFVDAGVKVSGAYCINMLLLQHLLAIIHQMLGSFFIFQQDSVLAHRVHETSSFLECETPAFILPKIWQDKRRFFVFQKTAFIFPDLWPPSSPDSNPVNLWHNAAARLPDKVQDVNDLKRCLINKWADMLQSIIDDTIDQWQKSFHACNPAKGG